MHDLRVSRFLRLMKMTMGNKKWIRRNLLEEPFIIHPPNALSLCHPIPSSDWGCVDLEEALNSSESQELSIFPVDEVPWKFFRLLW